MFINFAYCQLLLASAAVEAVGERPAEAAASITEDAESVSLLQIGARPMRNAVGAEFFPEGALLDSMAVQAARAEIEKIANLRRASGQGQALDHQHGDLAFFSGGTRYLELHKDDFQLLSDVHAEPKEADARPDPDHKEILFQQSASPADERTFQVLVQEANVVDTNDSAASEDKQPQQRSRDSAEHVNVSKPAGSLFSPILNFLSGGTNHSGAEMVLASNVTEPPKQENLKKGDVESEVAEQDPKSNEQEELYCQATDSPEAGFDREGGDLMARPVTGGVESCIEKCCSTAGCLAYVYAKAPSKYGSCEEGETCCYLKNEVTEKKQSEYTSVATGLVRRRGPRGLSSHNSANASSNSLMDVVGAGGVLKIALASRPEWEERETGHITTEGEEQDYQTRSLRQGEITPTIFNATDAETSSEEELKQGCRLESDPDTSGFCKDNKKDGSGCKSRVESAIADSHRRALLAAQARNESDWTLIMEDDVVPVNPSEWSHAFQEAWPKLPSQYKMIRLGWCTFEEDLGLLRKTSDVNGTGTFHLNNWMSWRDQDGGDHYYSGGCTTAYMVHREIIPEILGIFPCCCPLDCCLEGGLYYQPTNEPDLFRGQQVVTNMDTNNTEKYSHLFTFFNQSGVLVQDNRQMRSTRPEYNQTFLLEVRNHSANGGPKQSS